MSISLTAYQVEQLATFMQNNDLPEVRLSWQDDFIDAKTEEPMPVGLYAFAINHPDNLCEYLARVDEDFCHDLLEPAAVG